MDHHATGQAVVWAGLQRPEVVHGGVICAVDSLVVMLVTILDHVSGLQLSQVSAQC